MTDDLNKEASPPTSASGERVRDGRRNRASPLESPASGSILHQLSPVAKQPRGSRRETLGRDLLAGRTVATLAVPLGTADAELAGLAPVAGLDALLLPASVDAFFGSSRQLIVGPEGSMCVLIAMAILPLAAGDPGRSASLAAFLVGGVLLTARLARTGWVADDLSRSVLTGCIHGVAAVVIIAQHGKLLGLDIDARDPRAQLAGEITASSGATIAIGVACLASLLLPRRRAPRPPGPLLLVAVAIATSATGDLEAHGIAVVAAIPSGLPNVTIPAWRLDHAVGLLPTALGIFFVGFADPILSARSFAGKPTFREVGLLDLVGERHLDPTVRAALQAARPARKGA